MSIPLASIIDGHAGDPRDRIRPRVPAESFWLRESDLAGVGGVITMTNEGLLDINLGNQQTVDPPHNKNRGEIN